MGALEPEEGGAPARRGGERRVGEEASGTAPRYPWTDSSALPKSDARARRRSAATRSRSTVARVASWASSTRMRSHRGPRVGAAAWGHAASASAAAATTAAGS